MDELIGKRFTRLLVISREENDPNNRGKRYRCLCDCGNEKVISKRSLLAGSTKSCSCLHKEIMRTVIKPRPTLKIKEVRNSFYNTSFSFDKEYNREHKDFIYKITHNESGKMYVGKTERPMYIHLRRYLNESCVKNDRGSYILRALKKYGPHSFTFEIIHDRLSHEDLNELEKMYIVKYNSKAPYGYNLTDGGEGVIGRKRSVEEIEKWKANWKHDYNGDKNPFYGKTHSEETKQKVRESNIRRGELNKLKKQQLLDGEKTS